MSVAERDIVTDAVVVLDAPLLIEIDGFVGAVVSVWLNVIAALALLDIFPTASLNHTYTVLLPLPLLNANWTFELYDFDDVTEVHPLDVIDGVVLVSDR